MENKCNKYLWKNNCGGKKNNHDLNSKQIKSRFSFFFSYTGAALCEMLTAKLYLWQRCCGYCGRRWRWPGKRVRFPPPSVGGTWRRTSSSELPGSGPGTPRRRGLRLNSRRSPGAEEEETMKLPPDLCKKKKKTPVISKWNPTPCWKSITKSSSTCKPHISLQIAPVCWGRLGCTSSDTWDWIPSFAERSPYSSDPTPGRASQRCRRSACLRPQTACTPFTGMTAFEYRWGAALQNCTRVLQRSHILNCSK